MRKFVGCYDSISKSKLKIPALSKIHECMPKYNLLRQWDASFNPVRIKLLY